MKFPQHETVLIAAAAVGRLLSECGVIDEWIPLEGQACLGLFSDTLSITEELRSWLNRCDMAVVWTEDKDGALGFLFQKLCIALV